MAARARNAKKKAVGEWAALSSHLYKAGRAIKNYLHHYYLLAACGPLLTN
jgi:hypothetical protein